MKSKLYLFCGLSLLEPRFVGYRSGRKFLLTFDVQGSTYLYKSYLQPFFITNTENIDHLIASAHTNVIAFVQSSIQAVWAFLLSRLTTAQNTASQSQGPSPGQQGNPAQNGPLQGMAGVWKQFGPAIMATGASLLSPAANKNAAQQAFAKQNFPDPNAQPAPIGTAPQLFAGSNTPESEQLRYRGTPGRTTPPPPFPVPQPSQ